MLLPQQLQRHPWPAQLAVHRRPVRLRSPFLAGDRWRRISRSSSVSSVRAFGSGQPRPARRARKMQSRAAVALTPRLTAIWRFDMPAADSLSTSQILRTGNLGPGIAPLPMERSEAMPIRGSPNGARRDQSERLVAIIRNGLSRSSGAGTPEQGQGRRVTSDGCGLASRRVTDGRYLSIGAQI
jgi:hypothetical protein